MKVVQRPALWISNVSHAGLSIVLGIMLLWDIGKPAPWLDEGATILDGTSISRESLFLPTYEATRFPLPTDRHLSESVWLPSNAPIGHAYLAAVALSVSDSFSFVRLVFALTGYVGIVIFSLAIRRVFPLSNMHIFFLCIVMASPHLYPFIRTIRIYPLSILTLSIFFWGLTAALRVSSPTALMFVGAGIFLTYLVHWPLFFPLVVGVGSVFVWDQWHPARKLWERGKKWVLLAVLLGMSLVFLFNNHLQVLQGVVLGHGLQTDVKVTVGMLDWVSIMRGLFGRVPYVLNSHVRLTGVFDITVTTVVLVLLLLLKRQEKSTVRTLRRGLSKYAPVLLPAMITWISAILFFALSEQMTNIRYSVGLHVFLIATCVVAVGMFVRVLRSKLEVVGYFSAIVIVFLSINIAYIFLGEPRKSKINQYQGFVEFLTSEYRGPMDYFCDFLAPAFHNPNGVTVATNSELDALAACLRDPSLVDRSSSNPEFVIPRPSPYPELDEAAYHIRETEMQYRGEYRLDQDYVRVSFPVTDFGFNYNLIGVPGAEQLADCSANLSACARLYVRSDVYEQFYR